MNISRNRLTNVINSNSFGIASTKYRFSGHETFPFRYTWLPKGIQNLEKDPTLFTRDDAIVTLGVGKNMVRSIRFWCDAMNLIEPRERGASLFSTTLGKSLLGLDGWDPYLEDVGTLWLLHWQLVNRVDYATTWHLAFTQWSLQDFTSNDLFHWLMSIIPLEQKVSERSLRRDIEVFIRTYVPRGVLGKNTPIEDTFDCPLVELGLIQEIGKDVYRFVRGTKPSLPDAIFYYALIDFWLKYWPKQKSISFETLLNGSGSPGAAFKLSEDVLCERLEHIPNWMDMIFDETAGRRQVLLKKDLNDLEPCLTLTKYYEKTR